MTASHTYWNRAGYRRSRDSALFQCPQYRLRYCWVTVVAHLHLCEGYELMIVPFLDTVKRGVFATRAPRRPNSIGISILRLEKIEDNVAHVVDIDLVDGAPVLDIKPFAPKMSVREGISYGWLEGKVENLNAQVDDGRFV